MKLSIIIPTYNEEKTILEILEKVKKADIGGIEKEIIIVDDFSKDRTGEILRKIKDKNIKIFYHEKNYGKGFAIRTALKHATGEIVIIQDADLEYEPNDYKKLLKPILTGRAKVVYGSRILNKKNEYSYLSFYFGGRLLTMIANILYGIKLTDEPTCYKVFRREVIDTIKLKCVKFEFCPEVTAKIAKKKIKIYEVPINYYPRSKKQGKKIKFKDGLTAIWTLIKYRFVN